MTDKTMVSVPRELAWRLAHATGSKELHALLTAPAEDVRAVVDEQDLFESVFPMPCHTMRFDGGYAATEFNAWSAHDFVKKWDGWKARARLNPQ